jgi:hypothetical protein
MKSARKRIKSGVAKARPVVSRENARPITSIRREYNINQLRVTKNHTGTHTIEN